MVLDGEKERDGSAINPCLIIVDTSLDAIERSKFSNFSRENKKREILIPGKIAKRNSAGK